MVASGCSACEKIITGLPKSEYIETISHKRPLSGEKGTEYKCGNCDTQLYKQIFMNS